MELHVAVIKNCQEKLCFMKLVCIGSTPTLYIVHVQIMYRTNTEVCNILVPWTRKRHVTTIHVKYSWIIRYLTEPQSIEPVQTYKKHEVRT